jgi:hypothetical protein
MKKKVGTFKIWLLAIAAVVAFSVLPKVSSLATEDQALVVKENKQEAADAAGDESSAENKQETAGEGANLEAQGLEIRNQVHDADENAQTYCHRETDDGKTDAEHNAHTERYQSLTTDIVVEFALHILHQRTPERTVLLREDSHPVGCQRLIIEQVSEKPCNEEWQQYAAQIIGHVEHGQYDEGNPRPSYKFIKCNLLSHNCSFCYNFSLRIAFW